VTRLFVAVWPPDELLDALSDLERPRDQGVRWLPTENLHVTLRFLGDADVGEVTDALARATWRATTAAAGPAIDTLADHSLVLPVDGVDELAETATRATRGLGTAGERRRFHGHLTVARLARRARPARALGMAFAARFEVDEVALVSSTLTPDGAHYETLATWPAR
jgi:2'-5' RNA ligase